MSDAKFLADDFQQFVPSILEKEQDMIALKKDFNEKWHLLSLEYDMTFEDPYADGPKPDWNDVLESYYWWTDIDRLYSLVWSSTSSS